MLYLNSEFQIKHTSQVIYTVLPDKTKAYLKYSVENGIMKLLETYVPPQYRGKGLAKQLVEYAISLATSNNLLIEPICSYTVYYFMKNPDKRRVLVDKYKNLSEDEWRRLYEEAKARESQK